MIFYLPYLAVCSWPYRFSNIIHELLYTQHAYGVADTRLSHSLPQILHKIIFVSFLLISFTYCLFLLSFIFIFFLFLLSAPSSLCHLSYLLCSCSSSMLLFFMFVQYIFFCVVISYSVYYILPSHRILTCFTPLHFFYCSLLLHSLSFFLSCRFYVTIYYCFSPSIAHPYNTKTRRRKNMLRVPIEDFNMMHACNSF